MINSGTIVEYTNSRGCVVETKATSDPYQLYGIWVIDVIGERLPVNLSKIKESPRAMASRAIFGGVR